MGWLRRNKKQDKSEIEILLSNLKSELKGHIPTETLNQIKSELLSLVDVIETKIKNNKEKDIAAKEAEIAKLQQELNKLKGE